ncbi:MAG: NIPSNAP family protein [Ilumatobacteraceae bacterium]
MLVQAYLDEGLAILRRVLGEDALVGLWTVELGGSMDEMIQIWGFDSEEDRRARRAALWEDPAWLDFAKRFGPLIVRRSMRALDPVVVQ